MLGNHLRSCVITPVALALAALSAGCESIIPRSELRALGRQLPPRPPIAIEDARRMEDQIAQRSGVEGFAFTESEFEPETRLPLGTEWILGVFIGE